MVILDERDQREIDKRAQEEEDQPVEAKRVELARQVKMTLPSHSYRMALTQNRSYSGQWTIFKAKRRKCKLLYPLPVVKPAH